MMKQTWIILAAIVLLPLTVLAHPGPLDENSCHFCTVNCEEYGLKVGDYVCHVAGDRSVNLTYDQLQMLQRHFRRLTVPTLRQVAKILREKDEVRNIINAADRNCRPTIGADGLEHAPNLTKYARLGEFGELLTALACKNELVTVPWITPEGNIRNGLLLTLKKSPTAAVALRIRSSGLQCVNPKNPITCTEWIIEDSLIAANAMRPLLSVASQIQSASCFDCVGMTPIEPVVLPEPEPMMTEENVTDAPQDIETEEAPVETGSLFDEQILTDEQGQ